MYVIIVFFLLGSNCLLYSSEYASLGSITSVAHMRVLAAHELPECNKKRLQNELISPRVIALCCRHFLKIDEPAEINDIQHFATMYTYENDRYVAVGLEVLELLRNEGAEKEDCLWAVKNTIGQMSLHEKEVLQNVKNYKHTYEQLHLGTFMGSGMSVLLAVAGGIGIIARFFC